MKIGRNDPCPCGSGRKFKLCCMSKAAGQNDHGPAKKILDEVLGSVGAQSFESLDALNAHLEHNMRARNQQALEDFCGISPENMTRLLYQPFDSPGVVSFDPGCAPGNDAMVLRIFTELGEAIGEQGLRATASGNLPLKFCKHLAERLKQEASESQRLLIGGIRSEEDLEVLHCTRMVAVLAGLIRKYRGKFLLTRKGRDFLEQGDTGNLYFEMFRTYTTRFNWAYRDGYPTAEIVQLSFLFSLFLLHKFGNTEQTEHFYTDKFLMAYPQAPDSFPDNGYHSPTDQIRHCYTLRALERFGTFFGLVEMNRIPGTFSNPHYQIRKSKWLDRFVHFHV